MPKKTSEQLRTQVVEQRKKGASYTQIAATLKQQGTPLSKPTLVAILKEAGLTKSAPVVASPSVNTSSPPTPTGPAKPSSLAPAASNGVDDFMPKPQRKTATHPVEYECDKCGAEFTADPDDQLPEVCPECGG